MWTKKNAKIATIKKWMKIQEMIKERAPLNDIYFAIHSDCAFCKAQRQMKDHLKTCREKCWVGVICEDVYNRQIGEEEALENYKEATETVLSYLKNWF